MAYNQARSPQGASNPYSDSGTSASSYNPYSRRNNHDRQASGQSTGSHRSRRSVQFRSGGGHASEGSTSGSGTRDNPYARPRRATGLSREQNDASASPSTTTTDETADGGPAQSTAETTDQSAAEDAGYPPLEQRPRKSHDDQGGNPFKKHNRTSTYGGRYAANTGYGGESHERTHSTSSGRSGHSSRNSSVSHGGRRRGGADGVQEDEEYRRIQQQQAYPEGIFNELPVLDDVVRKFPELETDEFNAIDLAMSMIDKGRRRVDPDAFYALANNLEQVVDTVVRTHHRSFTDTIDAYSGVLEAVTLAQAQSSSLKADMIECKELLRLKRSDLGQWWSRSQQHREMIRLLDSIEELKKVPEQIEQLRKKQQHTEAVEQVVQALEKVEHGPLSSIGALSDLKKQLLAERNTMHERLIEELLKLLYLKRGSVSCEEADELDDTGNSDEFTGWDHREQGAEDLNNPVKRLAVLVECLYRLQKLPEALETVRQRMPAEVHQLVDNIIAKVEQEGADPVQLMRPLQSRLLRVIEIHRQTYIKTAEISMDADAAAVITELSLGAYKEAWMTVQNELKSFFYDYLSEDQHNIDPATTPAASINEALRSKNKNRDNRKKLFRLLDQDALVDFSDAYEEVQKRIESTFPQLRLDDPDTEDQAHDDVASPTSKQQQQQQPEDNSYTIAFAAGLISSQQALGRHRLLAKPGPVITAKLFRPMLEFLERARRLDRIIDVRDILAFMQDFYTTFFLPISDPSLQDSMGGPNGLATMVKEIMGEALLAPAQAPTAMRAVDNTTDA